MGSESLHSLVEVLRGNGLVAQSFQLVSSRHVGDFCAASVVRSVEKISVSETGSEFESLVSVSIV